jgi:hypothetical protein
LSLNAAETGTLQKVAIEVMEGGSKVGDVAIAWHGKLIDFGGEIFRVRCSRTNLEEKMTHRNEKPAALVVVVIRESCDAPGILARTRRPDSHLKSHITNRKFGKLAKNLYRFSMMTNFTLRISCLCMLGK